MKVVYFDCYLVANNFTQNIFMEYMWCNAISVFWDMSSLFWWIAK